jgi:alpha-glucosidase
VPMWAEAPPSTSGFHPAVVELHVFAPQEDGEWQSLLQEDDGLTLAALDGACRRTTFTLARTGGELTLRAERRGGAGARRPRGRPRRRKRVRRALAVTRRSQESPSVP